MPVVELPGLDEKDAKVTVTAKFAKGVLTLEIGKTAEVPIQGKRIELKTA